MDVLTLTLNEEGRVSKVLQDFKIMRDSYGNILINIEVPETLFVEALQSNGEYITGNNVRVGAIIRTATGMNVPTKKYELSLVKEFERDGVGYRLYQRKCPQIFTMWETVSLIENATCGLLELVINVVNWSIDGNGAKIEKIWPSQLVPIDVYASDFIEEGEEIASPSDFELLHNQVQEEIQRQRELDAELFGTDADKLGTYLLERLIAGNKITIQKDTTNSPNNKIKVSVETINANEVPIENIEEIDAKDVQGALEELSKRSDSKYISSIVGIEEGMIDSSDPHNLILLHDNTKADKVEVEKKADKNEIPNVENFITKEVDNLTNYTISDKVGNKIQLSINHDTYVVSLNLLNSKGEVLSSGEIDLPIESLVIGATYSSGTLHLTLKNGNAVSVDISSLVSGLVPDARTINGKKLDSDISLSANDVGAYSKTEVDNIKEEIEKNIAEGQGTTVFENGEAVTTFDADLKADKSSLDLTNQTVQDLGKNKADRSELFSKDYNDLNNKPKIPTNTNELNNNSGFITEESDPTVPSWAKQASKPTYAYSEITEKPTLATVATSGNYNDLSNKPTIPDVSGKADLNNANQTITANDIVLQGVSMFNYCASIVKEGSNANGYYTYYADGTLVCRNTYTPPGAGTQTTNFPMDFINSSYSILFSFAESSASTGATVRALSAITKGTGSFTSYEAASLKKSYIAIGKWK